MLDTGLGDRLCLVTGAASGIGYATAEMLAAQGARLALWDLDAAALEAVPTDGAAAVERATVDVADHAAVEAAVAALPGPVAAVVHCAGIYTTSPLPEVDEASWDRVLDVNLKGAFNVAQAVAPGMTRAGGGSLVLFGSFAARTGGLRASAPYASSKAGIAGLTKHLAQWGGPHGIRVNCIHPGFIQTPMNAILSDEAKAQAVATTPLRRLGDPPECAAAAVFLASDLASFVHGVELDVNGGMYLA
jgi:NAD(P)-dependent dehydrogenase (short-subunit alcohol dehydrogenase family)